MRLEDYVVRGLIDFDDVSYDDQADLLYKLATQVVEHLRSYLKDEDEVRNVLVFHQRQIATFVHTQMQPHAWEEASSYEAVVSQGFSEVRAQAFAAPVGESSSAVRPTRSRTRPTFREHALRWFHELPVSNAEKFDVGLGASLRCCS